MDHRKNMLFMYLRISLVLLFSVTLTGQSPLGVPLAPFGKNANFPCVPRKECARIYGTEALDVARFGNIAPCQIGLVRCVSVITAPVRSGGRVPVPVTSDARQVFQGAPAVVNQAPRRPHLQRPVETTTSTTLAPKITTTTTRTTTTTTTQSPFRFPLNDFGLLSIEPEGGSGPRSSKSVASAGSAIRVVFSDFVTPPAPLDLDPTPNSYIERTK